MIFMPWGQDKQLRRDQDQLGRHGELAVPGETEVILPAGEVKISYRESIWADSSSGEVHFGTPASLEITITSAGGKALEIEGKPGRSTTVTRGEPPWTSTRVGEVEVTEPGIHTITATADDVESRAEPTVLIG